MAGIAFVTRTLYYRVISRTLVLTPKLSKFRSYTYADLPLDEGINRKHDQRPKYGYIRDCFQSPGHTFIDHDDKVEEKPLSNAFAYTSKLYKQTYRKSYSMCFCSYCSWNRNATGSQLSVLFKSLKKLKSSRNNAQSTSSFNNNKGATTHASEHGSVVPFILPFDAGGNCCAILYCAPVGVSVPASGAGGTSGSHYTGVGGATGSKGGGGGAVTTRSSGGFRGGGAIRSSASYDS
ncbi:hypothetical protein Cantr_05840 [Candida viswanathii]|uniref:Uncharacterized protein n=1 Tax=Candida viswanathii TaxID=5486 RepID=A0A367XR01_9ASCO|nr:hypothetical protein Cantr_05840 [Candida viswanathii]